ncbi:MAG: RNA polymerase factor sigma-54 [Schleiferiaceae bacterium]|nr:RNA polymerase factor sigma-54 [Schleiferiaceae bacterium]MDR9443158.1 RNA polymerase factor sigma-54 [Schleiferiaceae bacterium]
MLKQQLNQKLLQKLSPQQIQLMKLIQLPTQALEQKIKEELESNPALEEGSEESEAQEEDWEQQESTETEDSETIEAEDIDVDEYLSDDETPDYRLKANNHAKDDEETKVPITGGTTFTELLMEQIRTSRLSEEDRQIAEFIIGNIDDDGYIRRDLPAVVDDLAFTQNIMTTEEQLEKVLHKVQQLDPPGVGARDLRECLLLQLERHSDTETNRLASRIIEKYFDDFTKKHYQKLMDRLDIDRDQLREAIEEITHLNPKPGNSSSSTSRSIQEIIPDFTITVEDGELNLSLNSRNAPTLNVSREYQEMLEAYKKSQKKDASQKEAVMFVKQKLDGAKWFIEAINQRQQTLELTMSAIMNYQKDYFLTGDERKLRPMILKDIADEIQMDISTVSRVASNKYVATPYGTFLIKEFFSESMTNEAGEEVSTREIKNILAEAVENEDKRKPHTDDKLAQFLIDQGYPIARRTVAKYREQLDIPVARLRKEL